MELTPAERLIIANQYRILANQNEILDAVGIKDESEDLPQVRFNADECKRRIRCLENGSSWLIDFVLNDDVKLTEREQKDAVEIIDMFATFEAFVYDSANSGQIANPLFFTFNGWDNNKVQEYKYGMFLEEWAKMPTVTISPVGCPVGAPSHTPTLKRYLALLKVYRDVNGSISISLLNKWDMQWQAGQPLTA